MSDGNKHCKQARRALPDLGFVLVRAKGDTEYYSHSDYPRPVRIHYGIGSTESGHLIENVSKKLGVPALPSLRKRDARAVKDRQARRREDVAAEIARSKAALDAWVAEKESHFGGLGKQLTISELLALEERIEATEREWRYWASQQTETVAPRIHSGKVAARHVS